MTARWVALGGGAALAVLVAVLAVHAVGGPTMPPQPPVPAHCAARGSGVTTLPDPTCTPGATNPQVTPATIRSTICVTGWTATVRPPQAWTSRLKRRLMASYGISASTSMTGFELDHLIPLSVGGAPVAVANLWPEPGGSPNVKDGVESAARAAVCRTAAPVPLAVVQAGFAHDWVALGRSLGVKVP